MEVINSFFSNIKDKMTNPFFGTLVIVLIMHHWELIFLVFNFDIDCTLNDKIVLIDNYLSENITWRSFLIDAVKALIYMLTAYMMIVFTRSLVMWVEFWLMPAITGRIINKNVVKKSEFDKAVIERDNFFDQYQKQRENVRHFSDTVDKQIEQIKLKDKYLIEKVDKITELSKSLNQLEIEYNKLKIDNDRNLKTVKFKSDLADQFQSYFKNMKQKGEIYDHLFLDVENSPFYNDIKKFPPEIIDKVKELHRNGKWPIFLEVANFATRGGGLATGLIDQMVEMNLAFGSRELETLTPLGKIIYHYRRLFENVN